MSTEIYVPGVTSKLQKEGGYVECVHNPYLELLRLLVMEKRRHGNIGNDIVSHFKKG